MNGRKGKDLCGSVSVGGRFIDGVRGDAGRKGHEMLMSGLLYSNTVLLLTARFESRALLPWKLTLALPSSKMIMDNVPFVIYFQSRTVRYSFQQLYLVSKQY